MSLYWVALAMIFSSLLGYKVAVENRLSGLTGLVFGLGTSVLVATDIWLNGWRWLGNSGVMATLGGVVAAACGAVFLVQKAKVVAYAKLIGILVPVAIGSIGCPKYFTSPDSMVSETVPEVSSDMQVDVPRMPVDPSRVVATQQVVLHRELNGTFLKTSVIIRKGAVLKRGVERFGRAGGRWVEVTLVRRDRSFSGWVPASVIE